MTETLKKIKGSPLLAWIKYNLIGAGIGFICGILLGLFVTEPILSLWSPVWLSDYHLEPMLSGVMWWLPFALGLGIAQFMKLKQWNIQTHRWVPATVLGWCLLGIALAYANDFSVGESDPARWRILANDTVILLLGGMCIGVLQSFAARQALLRPGIWILTNTLGVFALIAITIALTLVPFALKSYIIKFFYAHDLYELVVTRDLLLLGFHVVAIPFVATITLFLPTGKLLLKYSVQSSEKEDRISYKTDEESAHVRTG